jgi:hypothetical protein
MMFRLQTIRMEMMNWDKIWLTSWIKHHLIVMNFD